MQYLEDLNPIQRSAVEHIEGPMMILAGAGSGKTRVLTYRIAHLIHSGVDPFRIMSLTFTNKAAKEMKERIAHLIGPDALNVWMGTFHSVFAKILRYEADRLGYPSNFTIYDTDDAKSLIKSIIKEYNLDDKIYKPNLVLNRISAAKNNLLSPQEYIENTNIQSEDIQSKKPHLGKLFLAYSQRCFRAGAMDFDDLLYQTNILFRDYPEVLHKYQDRFEFLLVDEFQDTNFAQYNIVKMICAKRENICVVGDDAQSIYAFRGANIQNILNFKQDYPDVATFKLEQNYRSTKNIVHAANSVIKHNKHQFEKNVFTENTMGEKIAVFKSSTDNEEGKIVAAEIFSTKINEQAFNKDFAILYRTNSQSRAIEEALRKKNIAYRIYGGLSFYQRKEIKDILAYFRLTLNSKDDQAFARVINYPKRGIGKTTVEKMVTVANQQNTTIWDVASNPVMLAQAAINSGAQKKIGEFVVMVKSFASMTQNTEAEKLAQHIAASTGLLKDLYTDKTPEGLSRYENIQELLNGLKDFEAQQKKQDENNPVLLEQYMQEISLLTDNIENQENENEDQVTLMTIHSAKGLEFKHVFIVGLEENLFPSELSSHSRDELEEERRLFYVALTRGEQSVTLSYADTRYRWGNLVFNRPSRFIEEIDQSLLEYKNIHRQRNETLESRKMGWKTSSKAKVNQKPKTQNNVTTQPRVVKRNLVKVGATSSHYAPVDLSSLFVGSRVEHSKFGEGKVLHIEGVDANKKATVFFQGVGEKQLLLKYAKLKVLS